MSSNQAENFRIVIIDDSEKENIFLKKKLFVNKWTFINSDFQIWHLGHPISIFRILKKL